MPRTPRPSVRFLILASAFLMQMCLGSTYAWSVFVPSLRAITGLSQGLVQIPFATFYLAFPLTLVFSGKILNTLGPRRSSIIGTALFGSGWIAAGILGETSFTFVVLCIGLLAGLGAGFGYIVPIAVCTRWFPRHPGLVTGIAVAGFAGGAALVSASAEALMFGSGFGPLRAISITGVGLVAIGVLAATQMRYPQGAERVEGTTPPGRAGVLGSKEFQKLYLAMVAGLACGFAVNANLKDLTPDQTPGAGALAVSVFAVANAAGRITWGWLFDRLPPSSALRLNLFAQAVTLAVGFVFVPTLLTLVIAVGLVGFNYGGVLVLYVSTVAKRWGVQHVGQVYGLLFTANIVAAPAPMLAGFSLDIFDTFLPAFLVFASLAAWAAVRVDRSVNTS